MDCLIYPVLHVKEYFSFNKGESIVEKMSPIGILYVWASGGAAPIKKGTNKRDHNFLLLPIAAIAMRIARREDVPPPNLQADAHR